MIEWPKGRRRGKSWIVFCFYDYLSVAIDRPLDRRGEATSHPSSLSDGGGAETETRLSNLMQKDGVERAHAGVLAV